MRNISWKFVYGVFCGVFCGVLFLSCHVQTNILLTLLLSTSLTHSTDFWLLCTTSMYYLFCDKYLKNMTQQRTLHRKRHRKRHHTQNFSYASTRRSIFHTHLCSYTQYVEMIISASLPPYFLVNDLLRISNWTSILTYGTFCAMMSIGIVVL